ncbi:MAG: hypothetical protein OEZ51_07630 [Nitrospinota bacterium]|nr:hypothetical protein [Nitrospinota bacterium]
MKKTAVLSSILIFSFVLAVSGLAWADDAKHMEEGSGGKMDQSSHGEYKDKKHSQDDKGHMEEGSAGKKDHDDSADHKKEEEGSKDGQEMKTTPPKREGS